MVLIKLFESHLSKICENTNLILICRCEETVGASIIPQFSSLRVEAMQKLRITWEAKNIPVEWISRCYAGLPSLTPGQRKTTDCCTPAEVPTASSSYPDRSQLGKFSDSTEYYQSRSTALLIYRVFHRNRSKYTRSWSRKRRAYVVGRNFERTIRKWRAVSGFLLLDKSVRKSPGREDWAGWT